MRSLIALAVSLFLLGCTNTPASPEPPPNLLGAWSGQFTLMTPQGVSRGATVYEFTEQTDNLVKGVNRWKTEAGPEGHDGGPLPKGINNFLGVIAGDGTIYLVADGDTRTRRLRMTGPDSIDFVEFGGGPNQTVVGVTLFRKK